MTARLTKLTTCVAVLVAAACVGTPSALSMPSGSPFHTSTQHSRVVTSRMAATPDSAAFDWSAAAIGALIASGTSLALFGIGFDIRRRHQPKAV